MDRYIGIDAHSASCTIAVIGPTGRRISSQVIETNGKSLVGAVGAVPGTKHIIFEEGNLATWMYELLSPLGKETVVVGFSKKRRRRTSDSTRSRCTFLLNRLNKESKDSPCSTSTLVTHFPPLYTRSWTGFLIANTL